LVIAAHPLDKKGLFDDDRISEWLQVDEFTNPDLLCLEVPKPLTEMSPGWRRLIGGGPECDPKWKRPRPIAYVSSSDGYRLEEDAVSPGNYVGCRFTWIKMSSPSAEALRQAMLDRDSRIRVQVERPEDRYRHPRVLSVRVKNAEFLRQDQRIYFSPNLNCLIGSRGTGKSSLMDYLREALDQLREGDLPPDLRDEVLQRIDDTFPAGAMLEVELETRGGRYQVTLEGRGSIRERRVFPNGSDEPLEDVDLRALFPCRFLSQREIDYSVAKRTDKQALRKLLDDFLLEELDRLSRTASELIGSVREVDARLNARKEMLTRKSRLSTQLRDLRGRLDRVEPLREAMPEWRRVSREASYFEETIQAVNRVAQDVSAVRDGLPDAIPDPPLDLLEAENGDLIRRTHEVVREAAEQLGGELNVARRTLLSTTTDPSAEFSRIRDEWRHRVEVVQEAFQKAKDQAEEQGLDLEEIDRLPTMIREAEDELERLGNVEGEVAELERERVRLLGEIREAWLNQTRLRKQKADELMVRLTPDGPGRKPLVKIVIEHQGAREAAVDQLLERVPDKRRINREDIEAVVTKVAEAVATDTNHEAGLLRAVIDQARVGNDSAILRKALGPRLGAFLEIFREPTLRELELERLPDRVDYFVYREDGTLAGPIDRVSAGQQGTAILNILLASGEEPLFVDTPEEGLDNEGVYGELVPLFRREKERRQVCVVTHNANIPVNGDAEAIAALEAVGYVPDAVIREVASSAGVDLDEGELRKVSDLVRWPDWEQRVRKYVRDALGAEEKEAELIVAGLGGDRRAEGRIKVYEDQRSRGPCVGALDSEVVKRAVQDVMEGSREAFDRRREMYGF